ncbi:MAG: isocitrate lyase [Ignavibacteria bacterium]|nr:isocitrate lyase [Ignavibacteria bacterium]MBK9405710.1 isocitrate lyase [Ignavibacteria bacterium]
MKKTEQIKEIAQSWKTDKRWKGIERPYSAEEVYKLRGSVQVEHTLARLGAERLWKLLHTGPFVRALGALTGNQAVQQVQAGLQSIYLSGWQVAADANNARHTYPDQSLYPADSVPAVVKRINNAFIRADQISHMEGHEDVHWFAPIVADAEAGFGGTLNVFELMKGMIEAGAAGVHFEDQLSSAKKCGHMGGKVLVSTREFLNTLISARLASDIMGVPTILIARTDANSANLLTNDIDDRDRKFIHGDRTFEGFFHIKGGIECAIDRGLSYAPYADLIWCETAHPDVEEAKVFAEAIHEKFPGKMLAYNCSPSFNWKRNLNDKQIAKFQDQLGELGYKYQFITLAGFHALNTTMFQLALEYKDDGMTAFTKLQELEFELEKTSGYKAVKHQSFVGTGYFDQVQMSITSGHTATIALEGSTEEEQFSK